MKQKKPYDNISVLVLDGSGRQVMPVIKGLHRLGCKITTICTSSLDLGYASKYPDNKLLFKNLSSEKEMETIVDREIRSKKYDIVIPLSDKMTLFLSKNFDEYNGMIGMPIPKHDVFLKAYDKQTTMEICQSIGIPCTISKLKNEDFESFVERINGYPIVSKPKSACGSIGFHRINNKEEFNKLVETNEINLESCIIQEYVPQDGRQFNVHAFVGANDDILYIVVTEKVRWFPIDGGSSCFSRTIKNDTIKEHCVKLLKSIHWRGCCEIELIEDTRTGVAKVMEINGRTSACVKICQLAGINISKSIVEYALGIDTNEQIQKYDDVRMRCIHTDLLWFFKSKKRFKTKPSWFNCYHTHDQIYDFFDPLPFFTYSIQSIGRYKKEMKKRRRL